MAQQMNKSIHHPHDSPISSPQSNRDQEHGKETFTFLDQIGEYIGTPVPDRYDAEMFNERMAKFHEIPGEAGRVASFEGIREWYGNSHQEDDDGSISPGLSRTNSSSSMRISKAGLAHRSRSPSIHPRFITNPDLSTLQSDSEYLLRVQKFEKVRLRSSIDKGEDWREYYRARILENFIDDYVNWFADELVRKLRLELEDGDWTYLGTKLPDLLQEFAIRVGHEGETQDHRDLMYIAHRWNGNIVQRLMERGQLYDDPHDEENGPLNRDDDSNHDCIALLIQQQKTNPIIDGGPPEPIGFESYKQIISSSRAFEWLLLTIRRCTNHRTVGNTAMETIRRDILTQIESVDREAGGGSLPINRISRPKIYRVHYTLAWHSAESYQDGDLLKSLPSVFERVLTFTGNTRMVQALPCEDYINQIWPFTGPRLIDSIMRALNRGREGNIYHELSPNKDEFFEVEVEPDQLHVYAEGNAFDLAEIGTQLAWLESALYPTTGSNRGFISNPRVDCVGLGTSMSFRGNGEGLDTLSCQFDLGITALADDEELGKDGNCWQTMISNFVIVQGFPIIPRPSASHGLEIPLNVAASFIDAQKVTYFKGRPVIKGFSTMLYPIKREDGITYWHVLGREDGRISFADPRVDALSSIKPDELTFSDLESSRHIVGWCSEVRNYAGTVDADLDIRQTSLKPPSNEWSLKEFQVGGGMYVTAQATFAVRQSQKPIEIKRDKSDYIGNMEWISRRHVILHDTEVSERRAWLVDGASALLHLVLASLWNNQHGVMRGSYAFNLQQLAPFSNRQAGMGGSLSTLMSAHFLNKSLRLKDPTNPSDWYLMKDRIVEIFDLLAQMIDHQEDMNSRRGLGTLVSTSPWKQHVGWDFADVASYKEPCNLKVTHLKDHGEGWAHFSREVHAITLFGCGFGNIMHPSNITPDPCARCFWESSAPKGGDILAVTLADLRSATEISNQRYPVVRSFVENLPDDCFQPCTGVNCVHQRIQAFRKDSGKIYNTLSPMVSIIVQGSGSSSTNGAVLFGMQSKVHRKRRGIGSHQEKQRQQNRDQLDIGSDSSSAVDHASDMMTQGSSQDSQQSISGSRNETSTPASSVTPTESKSTGIIDRLSPSPVSFGATIPISTLNLVPQSNNPLRRMQESARNWLRKPKKT